MDKIKKNEVVSIDGSEVHVTKVDAGGGVHGHETKHCNEVGCNGVELYFGKPDAK